MTQPPTHEFLLKSMKPGSGYAVHTFSIKIGTAPAMLKPVLHEMLALGKLSTFLRGKNTCFIIAGTEHLRRARTEAPKPAIDPASIAQPRILPMPTGELKGYFAEMYERADLAMLGRGMR